MKIAIVPDLHLNKSVYKGVYDRDNPSVPFRSADFMRAFESIVDKCINELKPDLFVIPGDVYDNDFVYDTPPDHTTVDMFGGSIAGTLSYDSSTVNIHGGDVWWGLATHDSSTLNIHGGTITCQSLIISDSSTLNIYGGDFSCGNSPGFSESSTVNIYGYGFDYDGAYILTGFLSDGSSFIINECFPSDYAHINLIVIPEPATMLLFALGGLMLRVA